MHLLNFHTAQTHLDKRITYIDIFLKAEAFSIFFKLKL